ncbi:MAG TPA: tetratricopeptide repeat protein [Tepidisphaeraceae bacterium]|nr:tetratricopeptide repeat protein [Tepidisphaeraceae bacterium]
MPSMTLQQAMEQAGRHFQSGQLQQALHLLKQILAQQPNQPDVLHLMGIILGQQGHLTEAIGHVHRAITIQPAAAFYYCSLGQMLASAGRLSESVASYHKGLELQADIPDAWHEMGLVLNKLSRRDEAVAAIERAIQLRDDDSAFWGSLGHVHYSKNDHEAAIRAYERALELRPDFAEAHNDLGAALIERGRFDEAVQHCERAVALRPDFEFAQRNLGTALNKTGKLAEAESAFRKALAMKPDDALAHTNLGLTLLLQGDFEQGWIEHEWRSRAPELGLAWIQCLQPQWDGRDLEGQTILLWTEQGFGDTIQMARYAPMVAAKGGKVLLRVQAPLLRIMQSLSGVEQLSSDAKPLPHFDVHCPLLSLPKCFGTNSSNIPADIPYLRADQSLVAQWQKRLRKENRSKVGLVWSGFANNRNNFNRSTTLDALSILAQAGDFCFISLQKGPAAEQTKNPIDGLSLVDWTNELVDFADTAALIQNLDLVISVDTVVAHLAGAMGKPVWTLLSTDHDWRFPLGKEATPWYSTMQLFRQPKIGDWNSVIQQVAEALRSFQK